MSEPKKLSEMNQQELCYISHAARELYEHANVAFWGYKGKDSIDYHIEQVKNQMAQLADKMGYAPVGESAISLLKKLRERINTDATFPDAESKRVNAEWLAKIDAVLAKEKETL